MAVEELLPDHRRYDWDGVECAPDSCAAIVGNFRNSRRRSCAAVWSRKLSLFFLQERWFRRHQAVSLRFVQSAAKGAREDSLFGKAFRDERPRILNVLLGTADE